MERDLDTADVVRRAEKTLGISLPRDYARFMGGRDGWEGMVGGNQLRLWAIQDLAETNEGYEVRDNAPGLVLFGTDGGLEAYGFDARTAETSIVAVPFVPTNWEDALPRGRTFTQFLRNLRRGDTCSSDDAGG